ncbi:ABC transporter permease [Microbacterium lacus]|uniref:ABC transporter permease n=1 Tax=Microbacterium lacus TaxID=415217 RepID=UPI00384EACD7
MSALSVIPATAATDAPPPSPMRTAGHQLIRRQRRALPPLLDVLVVAAIVLLLLMALVGPLIAPHDPFRSEPSMRLLPAGPDYWLGTDSEGRDILSRLLAGAQPTILSALLVVAISTAMGVAAAALAAAGPRWVDETVMRTGDILLALPGLLLALAIAATLGSGLEAAIIALVATSFPATMRIARASIERTMSESYVEAARTMGLSRWRLMSRHVLPNSMDEVIVNATALIGQVTLIMAGLSFIGVGAQPPSAEWGAMASASAKYIFTNWPAAFLPGLFITISAVAFALLGEMLQTRLDPALRTGGRR